MDVGLTGMSFVFVCASILWTEFLGTMGLEMGSGLGSQTKPLLFTNNDFLQEPSVCTEGGCFTDASLGRFSRHVVLGLGPEEVPETRCPEGTLSPRQPGSPTEKLEAVSELSVEKEVCASLLGLMPHGQAPDKQKRMDGLWRNNKICLI